ncbi:MAG: DMT family transporter [Candidatus Zophobacter franzmannii]|nr:DMT family transporter [Candidatus Zophobacter franzmannii]
MKKSILIYTIALTAMICWSLTFILYKVAYKYYHPFTLVFLRLLIATVFLEIIALFGKRDKIAKEDRKAFFLMAFFEPFLYFMGESFGLQYISATVGAIMIAIIPLITPFFSWIVLKERVTLFGYLGAIVSFVGVYLTVSGDADSSHYLKGILFMLLAVGAGLCYGLLVKPLSHKYSSFTIVRVQSTIGLVLFLPFFLIFDFSHFITVVPSLELVLTMLTMGIVASVFAYVLYTIAIRNIGLNNSTYFANLIPAFTAIEAYLILHEEFSTAKILGVALVVGGLFASQYFDFQAKRKRRKKEKALHLTR